MITKTVPLLWGLFKKPALEVINVFLTDFFTVLYGGYDFMHAFAVMTMQLAKGFDVILTDKEGWEFSNNYEWNNHKRVTYDVMKPHMIVVGEYSFEINKVK